MGLAAPQVGVNVRLMVFNESGKRGSGQEMVLVNPEIVSSSKTTELDVEGCLSFPKIYGDVERSTEIVVKAQDAKGQPVSLTLKGFVARVFQHEFDHLQVSPCSFLAYMDVALALSYWMQRRLMKHSFAVAAWLRC